MVPQAPPMRIPPINPGCMGWWSSGELKQCLLQRGDGASFWIAVTIPNVGGFAEIDGVHFSQGPKETPEQKPKQRMRVRM